MLSESDLPPVLTIDGPSGVGKGTISCLIAKHLNWHLLDSGALYRVLALQALNKKINLNNIEQIAQLVVDLPVKFNQEIIELDNIDVSQQIREERCSVVASKIAVYPQVRSALLARQRAFLKKPGLVADGRDMGTTIFPQAFLKVFLDATVEERAHRRYLQLKKNGLNVSLPALVMEIANRDRRDRTRAISPMLPAKDAIVIDTSGISIEGVFNRIINEVKNRL